MSAATMNIPEPIIDPATTMVASNNLSDGLNEVACSLMFFKISLKIRK
jgi:hypothetical protein